MRVLDLFSGMGGLSLGFQSNSHFKTTGIDKDRHCVATYQHNIGSCLEIDLRGGFPEGLSADILVGGPPCRPWSRLSLPKSGDGRYSHPDRPLIRVFQDALVSLQPCVFIMENVPLLLRDELFSELKRIAIDAGYSVEHRSICYADYGTAIRRHRLFLFGVRKQGVDWLIYLLERRKALPLTVGDVIRRYERYSQGAAPDHEWANLRTIEAYRKKYASQQYGWYVLNWDAPAPSFGNIQKTYILHPNAWEDSSGPRVLSVREAMAIMGFNDSFVFPESVPITAKYRMVADAVSPVFSAKCAEAIGEFLAGRSEQP